MVEDGALWGTEMMITSFFRGLEADDIEKKTGSEGDS